MPVCTRAASLGVLAAGLALSLCAVTARAETNPGDTLHLWFGSSPSTMTTLTGTNYAGIGELSGNSELFAGAVAGGEPDDNGSARYFSDSFVFGLPGGTFASGASAYKLDASLAAPGVTTQPGLYTLQLYQGGHLVGSTAGGSLVAQLDPAYGNQLWLSVGGNVPGEERELHYSGRFTVAAVPEPSSAALFAVGGFALLVVRRRSRKR